MDFRRLVGGGGETVLDQRDEDFVPLETFSARMVVRGPEKRDTDFIPFDLYTMHSPLVLVPGPAQPVTLTPRPTTDPPTMDLDLDLDYDIDNHHRTPQGKSGYECKSFLPFAACRGHLGHSRT